jgi:hypothetical protein
VFALVTGLSLALSYYATEPLIERHFNRLGHLLASRVAGQCRRNRRLKWISQAFQ